MRMQTYYSLDYMLRHNLKHRAMAHTSILSFTLEE